MNNYLKNKLEKILNTKNFISADFMKIDDTLTVNNINFHEVRGSVRLIAKNVLTPAEVKKQKERILNFNFES